MGWIWVPSPREVRLVPTTRLQGSHFLGAGWTLGGFHRISCRVPATLFSQRHLPNSRHHYFTQGTPVLTRRACKKPGGASEEKRGRGNGKRRRRRRHAARSIANPRGHHAHPLFGSEPIQPPHVPPQVHPELTAGRPAEQDNQKQNEEAKTALGVTHLSLCHLDPSFARVRGCQVRTCDPLPLAGSCGLDLRRLRADCLAVPPPTGPAQVSPWRLCA